MNNSFLFLLLYRRKGLQLQHDLEVCHQGAGTDVNEMRMLRRQWQQNLNWEIQKVTLELIVNMFRSVMLFRLPF